VRQIEHRALEKLKTSLLQLTSEASDALPVE
jgi:DNA-directed RNA polymerase sigma subunit (sigma70/sigma32)